MAMLLVFEIASCTLNNHESSTSDKIVCVIVLNLISATGKLVVQSWLLKHRILLKIGIMDKVHEKKIVSLHSEMFFILWLWY